MLLSLISITRAFSYSIIPKKKASYPLITNLNNYFITLIPPIYGCNAFGIFIDPSSFKLFSKNAINILGGATTVLFNVLLLPW